MNVLILLEDTGISRRARIAMACADALLAQGHRARIATTGAPVTWRSSAAEWIYLEDLRSVHPAEDETVLDAEVLAGKPVVDEEVYRDGTPAETEPLRVLLPGAAGIESHGVDDGYGAVAHARWFHQQLDLIRVSPWAPSRAEPLDTVHEFHVALSAPEMTRLLHSCDIVVAPAHREEGFTLTAAEAMAAGVPCVLASTAAYAPDEPLDYALFAPERNAVELGERLIELASDRILRDRLRTRARALAEQWRADAAAERIISSAP